MISDDIRRIRAEAPLILNITNYVVMNTTANALLAIGASPVMAHALEEVEELVGHARALVINIGTLSGPWVAAMLAAGRKARERKLPVDNLLTLVLPWMLRQHSLNFSINMKKKLKKTWQKNNLNLFETKDNH